MHVLQLLQHVHTTTTTTTALQNETHGFSATNKIYSTLTELSGVQFNREHLKHIVFFGIVFRVKRLPGPPAQDQMLEPLNDRK